MYNKVIKYEEVKGGEKLDMCNLIDKWKNANSVVVGIFTVLIVTVLPLIFRDYYFDILTVKYTFYYVMIISLTGVMMITAIIFLCLDVHYFQFANMKKLKNKIHLKRLRKSDWAMMVFLLSVTISTFQSEYFYESFWGNEGRFMGMFLILLYGVSFYIIGHCMKFKQWYLDVFLLAGMVVCIIGILQYFKFDPLGFKAELDIKIYSSFTSTIGNINTYTSYVALILGTSVILTTVEKIGWKRLWYYCCVVISMFALITGTSDNAYLALAALFGFLPLYLFKNIEGVKKYMFLVAVLFSEFQVIDFINQKYPNKVLNIGGLFNAIVAYDKLPFLIMVLWALTAFLWLLDALYVKVKGKMIKESNIGIWIWGGLIVIVVLYLGYMFYDANIGGDAEKYGVLKEYIVINDGWGSGRGYAWRIGMESYMRFPTLHKIFGFGPDTYGIITVNNYLEEMLETYHVKFDSAHNEYLQYLITIGVVGLLSYLGLIVTAIFEMIQVSKKNPLVMAIVFAVICYSAQAVVNISVPIVAPVMMTLMMIGVSIAGSVEEC